MQFYFMPISIPVLLLVLESLSECLSKQVNIQLIVTLKFHFMKQNTVMVTYYLNPFIHKVYKSMVWRSI